MATNITAQALITTNTTNEQLRTSINNTTTTTTTTSSIINNSTLALSCQRTLQNELKCLMKEPLEGFKINVNENNMLDWDVAIFGPPETPYAGGYFKAKIVFPTDYPFTPPKFSFIPSLWHPNVYHNGDVCISILHPPGDDPMSGETPNERWNPTQSVRTILLSVQSLLNEPNTASAANVDASVMYREWRKNKVSGKPSKECEYTTIIREQVELSKQEAEKDGVQVPETLAEYLALTKPPDDVDSGFEVDTDYPNDCYYDDDDDDDYGIDDNYQGSETEEPTTPINNNNNNNTDNNSDIIIIDD